MKKLLVAVGLTALLAGCAGLSQAIQQVSSVATSVDPKLLQACSDAMAIAPIVVTATGATPAGPIVASIAGYVQAGCGSADAILKLAAEPSSTEWVSALVGELETFLPAKS